LETETPFINEAIKYNRMGRWCARLARTPWIHPWRLDGSIPAADTSPSGHITGRGTSGVNCGRFNNWGDPDNKWVHKLLGGVCRDRRPHGRGRRAYRDVFTRWIAFRWERVPWGAACLGKPHRV